jgi:hypothetical protein
MIGWEVIWDGKYEHVMPVGDIKPHSCVSCWCRPLLEDWVMIHSSMDKREHYESSVRMNQ